jgi:uncharacterized protein YjbI with pentapeptide repeats
MPPKIFSHPEAMVGQSFYRFQAQDRLSLSVYLGFSLLESARVLPLAEALKGAMEALSSYSDLGIGLDAGPPKPRGEFLVAGSVFAPYGSSEKALAASFAVGPLRRDFLVFGPQAEGAITPGEPTLFKAQPLSWTATSYCEEWNPAGLKPGDSLTPGGPPLGGPLVVEADYDRDGRVEKDFLLNRPACPLPYPAVPGRTRNLGSFDHDWLIKASPGFPDDFDWSFFNVAQKEQRLPQGYFRGDERVQASFAHAHYPHFDIRLPGLRPRILFLAERTGDRLLESRGDLDTIWLFPQSAAGLLIWRAQLMVKDELASDVLNVFVGFESLAEPARDPRAIASEALDDQWPALPLAMARPLDPYLPPIEDVKPVIESPPEPQEETALTLPAAPPLPAAPASLSLAPLAPLAIAPAAAIAAGTPAAQAASIIAETRKTMAEELPGLNETLRELGLPELTMDSMEPHLKDEEKRLVAAFEMESAKAAQPVGPDDDLQFLLESAGISPDRAEGVNQALNLPMPEESGFATKAAYDLAMKDYGLQWAALLGLAPGAGLAHASKLKAAAQLLKNPADAGSLGTLLGNGPGADKLLASFNEASSPVSQLAREKEAFVATLKDAGVNPDSGAKIFDDLNEFEAATGGDSSLSLAEREKLTLGLGSELEASLNLPAGGVTGQMKSQFLSLRRSFYGSEGLGLALIALAGTVPGLTKFLPALDRVRLNPSLPQKSLAEIAKAAGLDDPALLRRVSELDHLNPPPKPAIEPNAAEAKEEPEESDPPPPAWEPGPSQVFRSREEVAEALANPKFRESPVFRSIWPGAALISLNLTSLDFSGLDLRGADFSGSDLSGAKLAGANCQGASFEGANLKGCDLRGASLAGARLGQAALQGQDLSSTALTGADFADADLRDSSFEGAVADGADFSGASLSGRFKGASLTGARFEGNDLDGADFSGALLDRAFFEAVSLIGANFAEASLKETSFFQSRAQGASFKSARAQNARFFKGCDLSRADFRGAFIRDGVFQETRIFGADFSGCVAQGLQAAFLDLSSASFKGAYLREASFFGSNLSGADLSGSDLLGASLGGGDIRGSNFAGASLYGADLYRIKMDNKTILKGADLNDTRLKIPSLGFSAV